MTGDNKIKTPDDDSSIVELTDESLSDVHGGITLDNGIKFKAGVDGVNNDTLFAGPGDDATITDFGTAPKRRR